MSNFLKEGLHKNYKLKWSEIFEVMDPLFKLLSDIIGPESSKVMLLDNNGHVCLTNDGKTILKYTKLNHPVAKLIAGAAMSHHTSFGDNCKSFLIMAYSGLKACENYTSVEITLALNWFLQNVLESNQFKHWLKNAITNSPKTDLSKEKCVKEEMKLLIFSFLKGKFALDVVTKLSDLFICFIWKLVDLENLNNTLNFLLDHLKIFVIKLPGVLFFESCLQEGLLLEKKSILQNFSNLSTYKTLVITPCSDFVSSVELTADENIHKKSLSSNQYLITKRWFYLLKDEQVNLLLCVGVPNNLVTHFCEVYNILLIDCLEESLATYICTHFNVSFIEEFETEFKSSCFQLNITEVDIFNKECICLKPSNDVNSFHSLVICSSSEELCDQYVNSLLNAVVMLKHWLQVDNYLISVETSTFYMFLYQLFNSKDFLLKTFFDKISGHEKQMLNISKQIVSSFLLSISNCIYKSSNSENRFVEMMLKFEKLFVGSNRLPHNLGDLFVPVSPYYSQLMLVYNVIHIIIKVLRIDQIIC